MLGLSIPLNSDKVTNSFQDKQSQRRTGARGEIYFLPTGCTQGLFAPCHQISLSRLGKVQDLGQQTWRASATEEHEFGRSLRTKSRRGPGSQGMEREHTDATSAEAPLSCSQTPRFVMLPMERIQLPSKNELLSTSPQETARKEQRKSARHTYRSFSSRVFLVFLFLFLLSEFATCIKLIERAYFNQWKNNKILKS